MLALQLSRLTFTELNRLHAVHGQWCTQMAEGWRTEGHHGQCHCEGLQLRTRTIQYSLDWMRWHSRYTCMYRHYCGHISHCATLHCMQLPIEWRPLPPRRVIIKWRMPKKPNWNQIQLKRLLTSHNNKMTSKSSTLYVCIGTSFHM